MSDIPPDAIEVGKVAGSGGLGFLVAKLADRWFTRADKDAGKLDQVLAAVNALGSKLDVQHERQITTRADVDKLEAGMLAQQLAQARLEGAFGELKSRFDHLLEQLAK